MASSIIFTWVTRDKRRNSLCQIYFNYWVSCLPLVVANELVVERSFINPGYAIINVVMMISILLIRQI